MYNLSEQLLESYASWYAATTDAAALVACVNHARNAGANLDDLSYIGTRAQYLRLAATYGEGSA